MLTSQIQSVTLQNDNFYYMRLPPFCKVQYGGFIMENTLKYELKLLDKEDNFLQEQAKKR